MKIWRWIPCVWDRTTRPHRSPLLVASAYCLATSTSDARTTKTSTNRLSTQLRMVLLALPPGTAPRFSVQAASSATQLLQEKQKRCTGRPVKKLRLVQEEEAGDGKNQQPGRAPFSSGWRDSVQPGVEGAPADQGFPDRDRVCRRGIRGIAGAGLHGWCSACSCGHSPAGGRIRPP